MATHPAPVPADQAPPRVKINRTHAMRLGVEAIVDVTTAERYLRGGPLRSTTRERLDQAARRLGIPLPAAPAGVEAGPQTGRTGHGPGEAA